MAERRRYVVIGGLPEPSGGVTVFNGDLVEMLLQRGHDVVVFDQNCGAKQSRFTSADVRVWPWETIWCYHLWTSVALLRLRADRVILHTSNTSGFLRLIVPITRGIRCTVFLHDGRVEATRSSVLSRHIFRWLMSRIDRIFIMSMTQWNGLAENGYPMDRVAKIVPVICQIANTNQVPKLLANRSMVILACGHETRIYNYEYAVRLLQELPEFELHLYLYGTHIDSGYLDELKALDTHGKLRVFRNKDQNIFLEGLSNARLFVRPNHVDSFGVSVLDALRMGTPVVASDVCERADGTLLFAAGDYESFRTTVLQALAQSCLPNTDTALLDSSYCIIKEMIEEDEVYISCDIS